MGENIITVPGAFKAEFLQACKTPDDFGLRIQGEDEDSWELPSDEQIKFLSAFVAGYFAGAPSKNWKAAPGLRYGYNKEGVFVNENHAKRFFGLARASASVALKRAVPEALPMFRGGVPVEGPNGLMKMGTTDNLLINMMSKLPSISSEMRHQVLQATFEKADANGNGTLSRPEVASMFRKVVNTMSARDVEDIMHDADQNSDHTISYKEFCSWLETSAPDKVKRSLERSLGTEADVVKAAFRIWDKNGDGLISRTELQKVLTKMCSGFSPQQVKTLCDLLDSDHDGNVDYDEFVDFLFFKHKRSN